MKYNRLANIANLMFSAVCQVLAYPLSQLANYFWPSFYGYVTIHALSAFLIASLLRLPFGWRIFNLFIVPAIVLYESTTLPSWLLLIALLVTALIYLPTFWTRVPYYPTSLETYRVISDLLPQEKEIHFIDLGCGFSSLLIYLAGYHPQIKFHGTEIGPMPYLISKFRSLFHKNLKITFESFWNMDFSKYDVIYAFLAPPPMEKLWDKVTAEMKKGGLFISNSFEVPATPDTVIEIKDKRACRILVYNIKK